MSNASIKSKDRLRRSFDGDESFIDGHRVVTPPGITGGRRRLVPEWTKSDAEVRNFLCRSFPKMAKNRLQHARAACWARVIHLYFRVQISKDAVANQMNMSEDQIKNVLARIRRASLGLNTSGKPRKQIGSGNLSKAKPRQRLVGDSVRV
jgi:hypothetical protein